MKWEAEPGDLVRLTSTQGAVNVGILVEEERRPTRHFKVAQPMPPTILIWKVLIPEGVYGHIREEGWQIEVLEEACP